MTAAELAEALATVSGFVGAVSPSEEHHVWDALDVLHMAADRLARAEALAEAVARVAPYLSHYEHCAVSGHDVRRCEVSAVLAALAAYRATNNAPDPVTR